MAARPLLLARPRPIRLPRRSGAKFSVWPTALNLKISRPVRLCRNLPSVMPSFSRPSVSNDNAYSDSLFKTLKYNAGFPEKPFDTLTQARQWASGFEHWYNEEHRHSAIQFVSPGQRHRGEDLLILKKREELYEAAKAKRPERWAKQCRSWNDSAAVTLNSKKSTKDLREPEQQAA